MLEKRDSSVGSSTTFGTREQGCLAAGVGVKCKVVWSFEWNVFMGVTILGRNLILYSISQSLSFFHYLRIIKQFEFARGKMIAALQKTNRR